MFTPTVPKKTHTPLFASDASPEGKPKRKTMAKILSNLNSYEIIREKVTNDMQPKAVSNAPTKPEKKKLLNF